MADTGEHLHVPPLLMLVPRDRRGSRRLEVAALLLFQLGTNGAYWASVDLGWS